MTLSGNISVADFYDIFFNTTTLISKINVLKKNYSDSTTKKRNI